MSYYMDDISCQSSLDQDIRFSETKTSFEILPSLPSSEIQYEDKSFSSTITQFGQKDLYIKEEEGLQQCQYKYQPQLQQQQSQKLPDIYTFQDLMQQFKMDEENDEDELWSINGESQKKKRKNKFNLLNRNSKKISKCKMESNQNCTVNKIIRITSNQLKQHQEQQKQQQSELIKCKEPIRLNVQSIGGNLKNLKKPKLINYKIISKYHNFSKLFFNQIVNRLNQKELLQYQYEFESQKLLESVLTVSEKIKDSGCKKYGNGMKKSDVYSHSHYLLMFLKLKISELFKLSDKVKEFHLQIFGLDIQKFLDNQYVQDEGQQIRKQQFQQKLNEINYIKQCFYDIFTTIELNNESQLEQNKIDYWLKIRNGIEIMNQGVMLAKFH